MKKFYFAFAGVCLIFFIFMYYSIWWFIGALAIAMLVVAYRAYAVRLEAMQVRNETLEQQIEQLNIQLDSSIFKEMKMDKEVRQVKQTKQRLLTVINHEIRTPMNGIMGMNALLAGTPLNTEQKEYADTIRSCSETLLKTVNDILVNDILEFSKVDDHEPELESKELYLRDCVEEVLQMFVQKTESAGIELMYDVEENVPTQIISDGKRLRQILMNLVENAVKFTHEGEIFIGISSLIHGTSKPELRFDVKDTGVGIASDQLQQLFKGIPTHTSEQKKMRNPGLGLVVCKKLVDLMGGTINATSEPGKGSHFIFTVPLTPSMKAHSDQTIADLKALEGKRIIVADNNETRRNIFARQLELWKMHVLSADTGKKVLEFLSQTGNIDTVLINSHIPDADVVELARKIKDQHPKVAIILIAGSAHDEYKPNLALFSSIISKPVRQKILRDSLSEIFSLANRGAADEPKKVSEDFSKQYPLHILIAEDNAVNQKLAIKMLNKLGYQPELAQNGRDVLELVGQDHYDIILMDVQMPEMDGLEATRMIRTCLDIQPVIIAVTANVMLGDRDECMQSGMDDYISKPIELNELMDQLEKWFFAIKNRRKATA